MRVRSSHILHRDSSNHICSDRNAILIVRYLSNYAQDIKTHEKREGYVIWRPMYFYHNISVLRRLRNFSDLSFRKSQNAHFMFNNFFSRKSCRLWDNVEKNGRAAAHRWQYDEWSYRHICRISNTYCFSLAIIVTRTRISVKLLVHCLSSYSQNHINDKHILHISVHWVEGGLQLQLCDKHSVS